MLDGQYLGVSMVHLVAWLIRCYYAYCYRYICYSSFIVIKTLGNHIKKTPILLQYYARESSGSVNSHYTENIPVFTRTSREALHRTYVMCQKERIGKEFEIESLEIFRNYETKG